MKHINEIIKDAEKEYKQASTKTKNGKKLRLDTIKLLKSAMMEYAKNKESKDVNKQLTTKSYDIQIIIEADN